MSPEIDRQLPPYVQITDYYRQQIQRGRLALGEQIPPVATIANEWGVAHATAAKVITQLQTEGLIETSPRGSFVRAKTDQVERGQARRLAEARQQIIHEEMLRPAWGDLTEEEREQATVEAYQYLRAAKRCGFMT